MDLKKDLEGLKSKLGNIEKDFTEKLIDMPEKEKLQKRLEDKENELLEGKKTSLVNLNIGGKIFTTRLSTLLSCKETIFYKTLNKHLEEGTNIPDVLFYDRSYLYFEPILNYLRTNIFNIKKYNRFEKEDIKEEIEYYGLSDTLNLGKKNEIEIEWDQALSKQGACTVDTDDKRKIRINSNTCYTHFVTNKTFTDENFQVELDVAVNQTDTYLFIGVYNSGYRLTSDCGCCNPRNAFFIQCDGSVHIGGTTTQNIPIGWSSQRVTIVMKVYLGESQKRIYFCFPDKEEKELGPYNLTGTNFKVYAGHCNTGNGEINIVDCFLINE